MDKDKFASPKPFRNVDRIRHISTPDRPSANNRAINNAVQSTKSRRSMFPEFAKQASIGKSSTTSISTLTVDDDDRIDFLYTKYLQAKMSKILLRKRAEEREKSILINLTVISKEYDKVEEELYKINSRIKEVINLSQLQNETDNTIKEFHSIREMYKKYPVEKILLKLKSILEPLDILRCKNIKLPETQEEIESFNEIIRKCCDTLKSYRQAIGTQNKDLEQINMLIHNFTDIYKEVEKHFTMLEETITNLQILVLKEASQILAQH